MDTEKTTEKKTGWTFLDTAIVLLFAAAAVLALLLLLPDGEGETRTVSVTITIFKNDEIIAKAIEEDVGGEIALGTSGEYTGKLTNVTYETAKELSYVEESMEYVYTYYPDNVDINVTLELECSVDDTAITFEGTELRVGTGLRISAKDYAVTGYIISTDVVGEEE